MSVPGDQRRLPDPLPEGVEIVERTTPYRDYFSVDRYVLRHRAFGGGWIGPVKREVFERGSAVGILLYDPDRDELVLIEQFRAGALAAGWDPWQVEIVAGALDRDEAPADAACREATEEANVVVQDVFLFQRYLVSPGATSEAVDVFCGRIDSTGIGGIHGVDHEDEDIRVFTVSAAEAVKLMEDGKISNSLTLIALQWFALNRAELRQRWARTAA